MTDDTFACVPHIEIECEIDNLPMLLVAHWVTPGHWLAALSVGGIRITQSWIDGDEFTVMQVLAGTVKQVRKAMKERPCPRSAQLAS